MGCVIDNDQAKMLSGDVVIPDTMDEIPTELFCQNQEIISVTIPGTVKKIGFRAFARCGNLEKVVLGEGLERIEKKAFVDCGLREITIPYSVREIGESAFFYCEQLETVTIQNPETRVETSAFFECRNIKKINYGDQAASDQIFHMMGQPFLEQHLEDAANLGHRADPEFGRLRDGCAQGDAAAMAAMADWLGQWAREPDASHFYTRAENYWRYRAYRRGNAEAAEWFAQYFAGHPGERLESILPENSNHRIGYYSHSVPGKLLNDLGFAFFDPGRKYEVKQLEGKDLVEVSAPESYVGPDEDGFGAEHYYDWWFLDENMQPIPGTARITATASDTSEEPFKEKKARAEEILRTRKVIST